MEIDLLLQTHCKRLRLPTLAHNYAKFAPEAAQANQPYRQFLLALLEQEVLQREANQERRRIQAAKFPVLHTLDSFDFSMVTSVNKAKILELARGEYLTQCENILLVGEIGTGKTHLATALGVAACRQGKRVRFHTAANLVHELTEAQDERRLLRLQTQLMKQDLIILDEVGFVPFSTQGSQLLFQFCSERYQRGSMILTTNLEFPRWTEVFGDPQLTGALLDRITHHCHIIECHGDSYRFKQSMKKRHAVT
ncbi:MAG: IS21-like element helper ATPase IstB [Chloroflexi bacterium]|nr:IS21-like element helper ATPase IstB [Chloroflexota bacterium]